MDQGLNEITNQMYTKALVIFVAAMRVKIAASCGVAASQSHCVRSRDGQCHIRKLLCISSVFLMNLNQYIPIRLEIKVANPALTYFVC